MHRCRWLALVLIAAAGAASAQDITGHRIRVTYDGTTGPHVLPDTRTCPGATPKTGAIVVEGNVYGVESTIEEEGVASYMGCGEATWNVDVCDLKDAGDEGHKHCVTGLAGRGKVRIQVEINSDRDGAYIQMQPIRGAVNLTVAGTCDGAMNSEIRQLHLKEAEVADIESVPAGKLRTGGDYRSGAGMNQWRLEVLPGNVDLRAYPGGPNDPCPGNEDQDDLEREDPDEP